MKIRNVFLLLTLAMIGVSCGTPKSLKFLEKRTVLNHTGYEPIDPLNYKWQIRTSEDKNGDGNPDYKEPLFSTTDEILSDFKNQGHLVSIRDITAGIDVNYGGASLSNKNSSYLIVMDYAKYRTEHTKFGQARIGIGLRMTANVTTTETGINLGDLFAIGLAAQAGTLSGTLMVDVIGIDSKEITYLLPFQGEINKTTIQNTLQALATIKSEIYGDSTKVFPQVLSLKPKIEKQYVIDEDMSPKEKKEILDEYNKERDSKINHMIDLLVYELKGRTLQNTKDSDE